MAALLLLAVAPDPGNGDPPSPMSAPRPVRRHSGQTPLPPARSSSSCSRC